MTLFSSHFFAAFSELSNYLNMYWSMTFISECDPSIPSTDTICGRYVGHIRGQLQSIYYLGYFGGHTPQQGHILQQILTPFDDEYGLQVTSESDYCFPLLSDRYNWNTVDIDAPYNRCSICDLQIEFPQSMCSQCIYIREFLESLNN